VDPRSQQLLDAYQQAETYQSGAGTTPDLRVPDYTSRPSSYDDPFGRPQQPSQYGQPSQQSGQHTQPPQGSQHGQQSYEPGQYDPPGYQPQHHQAPAWGTEQPPADSTIRMDPAAFRGGDALGEQPREGDDPIDPTAIYTPNEPRR